MKRGALSPSSSFHVHGGDVVAVVDDRDRGTTFAQSRAVASLSALDELTIEAPTLGFST
jgi:hypothetical protein